MVPLGIPYSKFRSWKEDDQDLALAWRRHQSLKCPNCGTIPDDWFDEDGTYLEPPPYEVVTERCLGCQAISEEHKNLEDDRKYTVGLRKRLSG